MADLTWPFPSGNVTWPVVTPPQTFDTLAAFRAAMPLKAGTYALTSKYSDTTRASPTTFVVVDGSGKVADMLDAEQLGTPEPLNVWVESFQQTFDAGAVLTVQKLGYDSDAEGSVPWLLLLGGAVVLGLLARGSAPPKVPKGRTED